MFSLEICTNNYKVDIIFLIFQSLNILKIILSHSSRSFSAIRNSTTLLSIDSYWRNGFCFLYCVIYLIFYLFKEIRLNIALRSG